MQNINRELRAIMVELCLNPYTPVIVWPDHEPAKPCFKVEPGKSWPDVKPGDRVQLRRDTGPREYWASVKVKRVILYRVFPVEFNDRIVNCAREWVEGRDDGTV
jgi:hypothetical protein